MADRVLGYLGGGPVEGPKRVSRTGLALVHENEIVYPAAGSAAEAVRAIGDASGSVQVYFPVQIEIREMASGQSRPADLQRRDAITSGDELAQAIDPGSP